MVRAILEGRKTQTRRVVKFPLAYRAKPPTREEAIHRYGKGGVFTLEAGFFDARCPFGLPHDRLWVRETWSTTTKGNGVRTVYRADGVKDDSGDRHGWWFGERFVQGDFKWTPSLFMPRWASRITLELTGVRVERLQDISEEDARAEGVYPPTAGTDDDGHHFDAGDFRGGFRALWDSINAKRGYGWAANPWVWVLAFKPVNP